MEKLLSYFSLVTRARTVCSALLVAVFTLCGFTVSAVVLAAENDSDRIDLEQLEIQGANELPKVLYIVPWRRAEVDDSPVSVDSMVDEVMVPVDREVLRRQVDYFKQGVFAQ